MIVSLIFALFGLIRLIQVKNEVFRLKRITCSKCKTLSKFLTCDWGDTSLADKRLNDRAIKYGDDRIVAKYITSKGDIFIITEVGSTITTILFANEY